MAVVTYPVRVNATLDPRMSRWLWLVKWLLAIPHYVVLFFLWIAFVGVSIVAFFAILFTGRYPRSLFEFNVGVLRWSWRVSYYTYGALGTDRYPPFTLADVPGYPAHLEIDYPDQLSRGLVLVKWWLLAIPHYLVLAIFLGGGTWALWRTDSAAGTPGLIGLLVLIAAIALAFTGRYPQQIFDFVLGMNRWVLRVAAYAGLMTDKYPPFRLDLGGNEAAGTLTMPATSQAAEIPPTSAGPPPAGRRGWSAGRVVSLVIGVIVGLIALALLAGASVATWATNTQRDSAGYLTTDSRTFATTTSALTSDGIDLGSSSDWVTPGDLLGTVRIRATPTDPSRAVFIGVAPQSSVDSYLSGVDHVVVNDWTDADTREVDASGNTRPAPPVAADIWTARASGLGTQTLTWEPTDGDWVIVVMNASGAPGVSVSASVGATVPDLGWIAGGLFAVGGLLLALAVVLIAIPTVRASRRPEAVGPRHGYDPGSGSGPGDLGPGSGPKDVGPGSGPVT